MTEFLTSGVLAAHNIYSPEIMPVDYGGTYVYNLSLHLCNGVFLSRSSLELDDPPDGEQQRFDATLALLQQSVALSGLRPRCDYLNPALTAAYRTKAGQAFPIYMISACLCGECCRYDGGTHTHPAAVSLVETGAALPLCPELFGGLPTPRIPCEIKGDRVVDTAGKEHTAAFASGAEKALAWARIFDMTEAILKAKSPSCGIGQVYDGSFSHTLTKGDGVCAALLRAHGFTLRCEEAL